MLNILCYVMMLGGVCTMLTSIIIYFKTFKRYPDYLNRYAFILLMMVFFLIGYIVTFIYMLGMDAIDMSFLLIVAIFFFGAIFCFSVVFVQSDLLGRLQKNANELSTALAAAESANKELLRTQSQLIFSEKMSTLGKMIAGISHEINTPIGVIKASAQNLQTGYSERYAALYDEMRQLPERDFSDVLHFTETAAHNAAVFTSTMETRALKRAAKQALSETEGFDEAVLEWMAGNYLLDADSVALIATRLSSGTFTPVMKMISQSVSILNAIESIIIMADRVAKIISSLKSFSHTNASDEKSSFDVINGIETVLAIYINQLKYNVEVLTEFDPVPLLCGYEDELTQVWNNLIQNALFAMSDGNPAPPDKRPRSKLGISVTVEGDTHIAVTITDNGGGIPPGAEAAIFEPFYTTKPVGIGSGLGLSISKQIVEKHGGSIRFSSEVGVGTAVTVTLPLQV